MSWVWGIDTGSLRGGLAVVQPETGAFATFGCVWRTEKEKIPLARSLQRCRSQWRTFSRAMSGHHPPIDIAVELASGRFRNPSLMFHGGVTIEGVTEGTDLAPHLIAVKDWKAKVHGSGNAPKEALYAWADSIGYLIADLDQLAALAIASACALEHGLNLALLHPLYQPVEEAS